jgi:lysozyme family protein
MTDLAVLQTRNGERWRGAKLTRGPEFERPAQIAVAHKAIYLDIQARSGVHWIFIACTHYRESDQNFNNNLGQGDPLNQVTRHVPAGRGPFEPPNAFADGAVDALTKCAPYACRITDWSIASLLTWLERYNGLAYANAGVPSPYIWSGTDQYARGKVMVDRGPIEPVVDKQLGCAGLILAIMAFDPSVTFDALPAAPVPQSPSTEVVYDAEWVQSSLNHLGATPPLLVDGINGAATRTAVKAFQTSKGLTSDGRVGPLTIDAIKEAVSDMGAA